MPRRCRSSRIESQRCGHFEEKFRHEADYQVRHIDEAYCTSRACHSHTLPCKPLIIAGIWSLPAAQPLRGLRHTCLLPTCLCICRLMPPILQKRAHSYWPNDACRPPAARLVGSSPPPLAFMTAERRLNARSHNKACRTKYPQRTIELRAAEATLMPYA